jgi:uncharacterized protein (UPF0276 family)
VIKQVDASGRAPLGVGLSHLSDLPEGFYASGVADFVEVTPEVLCQATRWDGRLAITPDRDAVLRTRQACRDLPMVAHGVELSIGAAGGMNTACLDMLEAFAALWPFAWHSEHLGFQTVAAPDGRMLDIGTPLPMPATEESARLVAERAHEVMARIPAPFLLENPAHYLPGLPADPQIGDEIGLIARILELCPCGQLLDLHNLYCNAVNFGFDPFAALDRLRLDRVVEVHLAGGSWHDGFLMDAHDGAAPEPVWEMLAEILPRAPNLRGVVFEVLDDHLGALGVRGVEQQLRRARDAWSRRARAAA